MKKQPSKVQMDNKCRICLGAFLSQEEKDYFNSFSIYRQEDGKIVLDPLVEIPARDHWIYKNQEALTSLMKGLEDAKEGRLRELNVDFSQFLDEEDLKNVHD